MEISKRFRSFRERSGLKQTDLAALLHVRSANYISQIERGEKAPGPRLLRDFELLEASPAYAKNDTSEGDSVRVQEDAPIYQTSVGAPQNMPPPHHFSDPRRQQASAGGEVPLLHSDYAQCVSWLSELFDRDPQAFRSAMLMIKGLREGMKK